MNVWAVIEDTYGAHETETVWSLWSTREAAEAERERLLTAPGSFRGGDGEHFHIVEVTMDASRDTPIES